MPGPAARRLSRQTGKCGSFRSCLRVLILTKICMCESSTIFSGRDEHGGSRRTHPSSQPAHYAVRTRGGCSYKIATPGGKPVASGRGLWARRSRKAYSSGCSAPALRLRCLRAYVGEPMQPREGRAPARPRCSRRTRPWSQQVRWLFAPGRVLLQDCDAWEASLSRPMAARGLDVPGKRTPRGVAHLRYACVVCALTAAGGCAPGRDEHQLVRGAAGGPAHGASRCAGCSHPGRVLLQGDDARGASLSRPMAACGLDVPGKRTPRGVAHLRYACVVCALTSASRCSPGRDEHQDRKSTRLNPSHVRISYAVFCLKKKRRLAGSARASR